MTKNNYLKDELYALIKTDSSIFEFIQSGSLDGMWYWDIEKPEYEWMSPKFWETLGYDPHEKKHLSSEWQDIIFQEDLKIANENFMKHCADPNHHYDQIVRYKHKNGSTVWIRCRGLAIRDEHGKALRMLGAHTDITDLKETEKEISRLTTEYEKVFNGTQEAMFLIKVFENGEFRYIRNNLAHQQKTGISFEQLVNKTPKELLGSEIGNILEEKYQRCFISRDITTYEEKLDLPNGEFMWVTTLTPIIEDGNVTHIVGSSTDITQRKEMERELERYANYDKLTDLPNRRLFFERLERVIVESKRDNGKFALLFIDLDKFKSINDSYGHLVGDKVLTTIGNRLVKCVRESDTVARVGGDEFTIIIRNIKDKQSIEKLVLKIQKVLQKEMHIDSIKCQVYSSIGIAIYPDHGKDSETLLKNADSAMYEVKRSGTTGFRFCMDLEIE